MYINQLWLFPSSQEQSSSTNEPLASVLLKLVRTPPPLPVNGYEMICSGWKKITSHKGNGRIAYQ